MADTFKIKKGDTKPYLAVTLQNSDETAIDLTDATIVFRMGNLSNYQNIPLLGEVTVTSATDGECEFRWDEDDTLQVGSYYGEFEITFDDGKVQTLPPDHSLIINIYEDYE
jgi:hypothetical protein